MLYRGTDKLRRVAGNLAGAEEMLLYEKTFTAAELRAISAAISLIQAPGDGRAWLPSALTVYKPAGTVHVGGGNLTIAYASGGPTAITLAMAGILDQTTVETRFAPLPTAAAVEPSVNTALQLAFSVAITGTGNAPLTVKLYGKCVPLA
jgi:hypothetical protein